MRISKETKNGLRNSGSRVGNHPRIKSSKEDVEDVISQSSNGTIGLCQKWLSRQDGPFNALRKTTKISNACGLGLKMGSNVFMCNIKIALNVTLEKFISGKTTVNQPDACFGRHTQKAANVFSLTL